MNNNNKQKKKWTLKTSKTFTLHQPNLIVTTNKKMSRKINTIWSENCFVKKSDGNSIDIVLSTLFVAVFECINMTDL